jgi:adenosylcobinamide kinase/adenosylcobinamide-phosphate guanylyltransferase
LKAREFLDLKSWLEVKRMAILVTGGARSGKSTFAEKLAAQLNDKQGIYIATAQIYDEEMRERILLHQEHRLQSGFNWITIEEPYEICKQLKKVSESDGDAPIVLVDCLTLWLSNWLLRYEHDPDKSEKLTTKIDELLEAASSCKGQVLIVTNEVGSGIVPEYPLGRSFRDLAGKMNQRLAALCDQVFLVTAGIPVELKSRAYRLE